MSSSEVCFETPVEACCCQISSKRQTLAAFGLLVGVYVPLDLSACPHATGGEEEILLTFPTVQRTMVGSVKLELSVLLYSVPPLSSEGICLSRQRVEMHIPLDSSNCSERHRSMLFAPRSGLQLMYLGGWWFSRLANRSTLQGPKDLLTL